MPPTECRSVVRRHRARWSMADFWIASIASGEPASTGCSELAKTRKYSSIVLFEGSVQLCILTGHEA